MTGPHLKNAPLQQVVCEVRLPPRPGSSSETIERLASALAPTHPNYELDEGLHVQIGPGGVTQNRSERHRFISDDQHSIVGINSEAFVFEVDDYHDIEEFLVRWGRAHTAVDSVIPMRKRLRLGLRYVNRIEFEPGSNALDFLRGAIDDRLLAPWAVLDDAAEPLASLQELRVLKSDSTTLMLRHGLVSPGVYILDFDHAQEGSTVPFVAEDTIQTLRSFNEAIYAAFRRSITSDQWAAFAPEEAS